MFPHVLTTGPPMRTAAGAGNVASLERLILGELADVEVTDDEGRTPLMCAARNGHLKAQKTRTKMVEPKKQIH